MSSVVRKPTSNDLRDYMKARTSTTRVIGPMEAWILTQPAGKDRPTNVLHPSEIIKDEWCPRASYFLLQGHPAPVRTNGLRLQNIFDEGHAIHDKWQQRLADMGNLYGTWLRSDSTTYQGLREGEDDVYLEVPLRHPDLRIGGHADGWITGMGDDLLLEIKSIGTGTIRMGAPALLQGGSLSSAFQKIRMPFGDHIRQATLYVFCLNEMNRLGQLDREPPKEIVFIYECKEDQAYKEFVVKYDATHISDVIEKARRIQRALNGEGPIPGCSSRSGSCKNCAPFEGLA